MSVWGGEIVFEGGVLYKVEYPNAIAIGRAWGTNEEIYIGSAGDYDVTRIKEYAFSEDPYLTTLYVYSTVTEIGQEAFWNCPNLTTVTFEDGLRVIRSLAFSDCPNLTSVTLPASVEMIDRHAFSGCDKLKIHYPGTKEQWEKIRGSKYIDISVVDFAIPEESSKGDPPCKGAEASYSD